VGLGAALGAAVFLLAALVHDRLLREPRTGAPPAGFTRGGGARGAVRVLATLGEPPPLAVLLPLREDGADTGTEEALLDAALFPSGPRHRWARLVVANPGGREPMRLSLAPGAVVLETAGGRVGNADVAAAFASRATALSAHRLLDLRVAHAHETEVEVPRGGFVRALVAFPGDQGVREAAGAEFAAGAVRLRPREVVTERLRCVLLDGRVDLLEEADLAEAPARGGRRR
jgi:hypothetical protein